MSLSSEKKYFHELIANNRLAHGYLLVGDSSTEKDYLVTFIAQSLIGQQVDDPYQLRVIHQRVEDNRLADILHIRPDGRYIRVDQIRYLREWLSKSPVETNFKLAIVHQAECMNQQASNALLKILEDPVANSYIFLYASDAQQLLPTILSRVQTINFTDSQPEDMLAYLEESRMMRHHAQIVACFKSESIDRWLEDYEEEAFEQWILALNHFYSLLIERSPHTFVSIQHQELHRQSHYQACDALDYLTVLNHSFLMKTLGKDYGFQMHYLNQLNERSVADQEQLLWINKYLAESYQYLNANVSVQLVFERLAIKLACWK